MYENLKQLLQFSGEQMDSSDIASNCGIGKPELDQRLDQMHKDQRLWLIQPFERAQHLGRIDSPMFYGLELEKLLAVKALDPLSHLRHVMAIILNRQSQERTFFWRDRRRRKIDFAVHKRRSHVDAIDCVDTNCSEVHRGLAVFRRRYPKGNNYLISEAATSPALIRFLNMDVVFCRPDHWASGAAEHFYTQTCTIAARHV